MIKFKNGNTIQKINTSNCNVRGKRSELMGFYCNWCNCTHIDYPIKNIIVIDNDIYCSKILEL